MKVKKPDPVPCGDCEHLAESPRRELGVGITDFWCTALPGPYREGVQSFGRHPGEWLGFMPVQCERCPMKPENEELMTLEDDESSGLTTYECIQRDASCDIWNEDCIAGLAERVPDNSVHLTVTSIPFEELFTYSGKPEDVGNNGSTVDILAGRFALNMRFVTEQLFRVTAPGCNVCIHIQQLLAYKNQHGFMGRRDFRGAIVDVFAAAGFHFTGDIAITKDPQRMAQTLNLHSLQFKTGWGRSSTNWAPAPNDYVLIFQKPGEVEVPVRALLHKKNASGWMTKDDWIHWARGTWDDILQTDVLDGWKSARESEEERHVCPLQLSVIHRLISMYTNPITIQPDVTVLDPFMGIGSTAYICLGGETQEKHRLHAPRNVIGFELKESYHDQATRNVAKVRRINGMLIKEPQASLF